MTVVSPFDSKLYALANVAEGGERTAGPALVLDLGDRGEKRRPLGAGTTVLGRGPGCDIQLEAPEIGNLHCVVLATERGWMVRDCESRLGTFVNGIPIREVPIKNGDSLTIGSYRFRVEIPPTAANTDSQIRIDTQAWMAAERYRLLSDIRRDEVLPRDAELQKLRLKIEEAEAELELLRQEHSNSRSMLSLSLSAQQSEELRREVDSLRSERDEALAKAEQSASRMAKDHEETVARLALLQRELEEERRKVKQVVKDAAAQYVTVQSELAQLRRQHEELAKGATEAFPGELDSLRQEIGYFRSLAAQESARATEMDELRQQVQELRDVGFELSGQVDSLREERDAARAQITRLEAEATHWREQSAKAAESAAAPPTVDPEQAARLVQLETERDQLRDRADHLQARLDKEHADSSQRLSGLQRDLEAERQRVKQVVKDAAAQYLAVQRELEQARVERDDIAANLVAQYTDETESLRAEIEALRSGSVSQFVGPLATELGGLRQEIESLRAENAELRQRSTAGQPEMPADLLDYEQQLHDFRAQLESAQQQLENQERELTERVRHTEMELSRERAEIAREKTSLDRFRAEIQSELHHAERDAKNLEKMFSIHRVTSEMRASHRPGEGDRGFLSDKIRGFLKKLGDHERD